MDPFRAEIACGAGDLGPRALIWPSMGRTSACRPADRATAATRTRPHAPAAYAALLVRDM